MVSLNYISAISIKKEYYDFCQEKNKREKKKKKEKERRNNKEREKKKKPLDKTYCKA